MPAHIHEIICTGQAGATLRATCNDRKVTKGSGPATLRAGLARSGSATRDQVIVAPQDDPQGPAPIELSHRICPAGEAVVDLGGDLDIVSAELAVNYVRDVIDCHRGPVVADLAALAFCDARGLAALLHMAAYAEQAGCPFRLASPSPSLVKIMRITGLDRKFLASHERGQLAPARSTTSRTPPQVPVSAGHCPVPRLSASSFPVAARDLEPVSPGPCLRHRLRVRGRGGASCGTS